jgi:hypothetical protein
MGWRDLPLVIWKNLDGMFHGTTGLIFSGLTDSPLGMYLSRFLAIGAIVGTVRLARQRGVSPYHWFGAAYAAILLVWHFPPNERFMLPVFPLLLAGLATETAHLAWTIKKCRARNAANRAVATGVLAGLAAIAGLGVALNVHTLFYEFPGIIDQHRTVLASKLAAFQ